MTTYCRRGIKRAVAATSVYLMGWVATSTAAASTIVGGPITSDTTWSLASSPYVVVTTVTVRNSATLTIEAGVEIRVQEGLGVIIGHVTQGPGTLKAMGTRSQPIRFTSDVSEPIPGAWKDIRFSDFSTDATYDGQGTYLSGCILDNCIVEYAGGGTAGTGAITIAQCSPFLSRCEVRYSATTGINADTNSSSVVPPLHIDSCNVHDNKSPLQWGGGVRLALASDLFFTNNTVSGNETSFVGVVLGGPIFGSCGGGAFVHLMGGTPQSAVIAGNTFSENATPPPGFANNHFGGGLYLELSGQSTTAALSGNHLNANSSTPGRGGGAYARLASHGGSLVIDSNSVAGNSASTGGGIVLTRDTTAPPLPWNFSTVRSWQTRRRLLVEAARFVAKVIAAAVQASPARL